jgi:ABC-type Fe3+-hydroxamate transport system substrate-binding protein
MRRSWPALRVAPWLLAATVFGPACAPDVRPPQRPQGDAIAVVDASGRELVLAHPARRVVSLVPSATETLRALGAERSLVGRTDFDSAPWVSGVPSVGGGLEPNLEAIVTLAPDLVVRFAGDQDPGTRRRLDELGIPHVAVRPDRVSDIYATARLMGRVTGREVEADSLVASVRDGLEDIARLVSAWPRLRVAYVLGGSPPWVAGPETYISEVLSLIGGDNVFADLDALYAAVSPEEIVTREIDVVLVSRRGEFDESLARGARIAAIGDMLEIPGPGVVEAAGRVAELLHGRVFE